MNLLHFFGILSRAIEFNSIKFLSNLYIVHFQIMPPKRTTA